MNVGTAAPEVRDLIRRVAWSGTRDERLNAFDLYALNLLDSLESRERRVAQLEAHFDRLADAVHPGYGECDGLGDGTCSECLRVVHNLRAEVDALRSELARVQ